MPYIVVQPVIPALERLMQDDPEFQTSWAARTLLS
jgi:hypothetical protein